MSRPHRFWTYPELRRISARRMDGEAWTTIVPDYDVGRDALRLALQRHGLPTGCRRLGSVRRDDDTIRRATELRNAGMSWAAVADAVAWAKTPDALRQACRKRATRTGADVWRGRGAA